MAPKRGCEVLTSLSAPRKGYYLGIISVYNIMGKNWESYGGEKVQLCLRLTFQGCVSFCNLYLPEGSKKLSFFRFLQLSDILRNSSQKYLGVLTVLNGVF